MAWPTVLTGQARQHAHLRHGLAGTIRGQRAHAGKSECTYTPDRVRQEAYGYLCLHYAIRALMHTAAAARGMDPDQVSFTASPHAARRSVRTQTGTSTGTLRLALARAVAETCAHFLPRRRLRAAARVVKRKLSGYRVKRVERVEHRAWPRPTMPMPRAINILIPPQVNGIAF
jgi:hypothetical protein